MSDTTNELILEGIEFIIRVLRTTDRETVNMIRDNQFDRKRLSRIWVDIIGEKGDK